MERNSKKMPNKDNKKYAQTVVRAFKILDTFQNGKPELSLKDISEITGLNKTVALRLLNTLIHLNLVVKSHGSKSYRLGPRLFEYGSRFVAQLDIRKLALPYMSEIVTQTMDTAYLMIRSGDEALMLERVEGEALGSLVGTSVGGRLPLHVGAAPMVLLLDMDEEEIVALVKRKYLQRLAANTVENIGSLLEKIKKIRENGYTIAVEDPTPGVVSLGAPVYNYDGKVVAGISIGLLYPRFQSCNQQMYIDLIVRATQNLSRDLGFSG